MNNTETKCKNVKFIIKLASGFKYVYRAKIPDSPRYEDKWEMIKYALMSIIDVENEM